MKKILLSATSLIALMGAASAADLPSHKAPPVAPAAPSWTGFYAGLNAGYNFGTNNNTTSSNLGLPWYRIDTPPYANWVSAAGPIALNGNISNTQSGYMGGLQFGYNYQWGSNIVIGIESDIMGSSTRGNANTAGTAAFPANFQVQGNPLGQSLAYSGQTSVMSGLDYLGTVRGRLGYLFTPTMLLYGTAGFSYGGAYAYVKQNAVDALYDNFPGVGCTFCVGNWRGGGNQNQILTGWNAGGGVEWMFMPNWSLKAEALYWNLGSMNVNTALAGVAPDPEGEMANNAGGGRTTVNYQGVVARAGLNYHFNWSGAPATQEVGVFGLPSRKSAPTAAPTMAWAGVYAGLNAGYNFGTNDNVTSYNQGAPWARLDNAPQNANWVSAAGPVAMNGNVSGTQSGFMGGFQMGYNYLLTSNVLVGLETDIQGSSTRNAVNTSGVAAFPANFALTNIGATAKGSSTGFSGVTSVVSGLDYLGTVRARLGYLFTPSLLAYGTAGFSYGGAYANVSQNATDVLTDYQNGGCAFCVGQWRGGGSQNQLLTGWNAGGGVEWMFMQNWSLKAEALYWNLGTMNVNTVLAGVAPDPETEMANNIGGGRTTVNYQGVTTRVGVNYHFNLGAAPVVASF